jgi:hypothetical protein
VLRAHVAGKPGRLALVDALEAEHTAIDPLLTAIDAAAANPDYGYQRFVDIIDELAGKLTGHLTPEESAGLPLVDASLRPAEWQHYAQVHTERIGGDAPVAVPWLLDGASPQTREAVLSQLPPPLRVTIREQWEPGYASLRIWDSVGEPAS